MTFTVIPALTCGLGNRLFVYAAAEGLAERYGGKVKFMLAKCHPTGHGDFENIFKMFPSVPFEEGGGSGVVEYYKEAGEDVFTYRELAQPTSDFVVLGGCRQSWKYGPRRQLEPAWSYPALDAKYQLVAGAPCWFLHVRLGDYRILAHHFIDLRDYYRRALSQLPRGARVLWASDEPGLIRGYLESVAGELGLTLVEIEETDELEVLYVLSKCRAGGIGSNSTFSWWAAYFARGGKNLGQRWFFPARWGNAGLPVARDIYCEWMTLLEV